MGSRSTHLIGLPTRADEFLYTDSNGVCEKCGQGLPRNKYTEVLGNGLDDEVTGMFGEIVWHLRKFFDKHNNLVFAEKVQCTPWSSGPMIFLKLVNGEGSDVAVWSEKEIIDMT